MESEPGLCVVGSGGEDFASPFLLNFLPAPFHGLSPAIPFSQKKRIGGQSERRPDEPAIAEQEAGGESEDQTGFNGHLEIFTTAAPISKHF